MTEMTDSQALHRTVLLTEAADEVSRARNGIFIDATFGRKTAAVLIMDSDHVVLSGLPFEKLAPRFGVDPTVLEEEA